MRERERKEKKISNDAARSSLERDRERKRQSERFPVEMKPMEINNNNNNNISSEFYELILSIKKKFFFFPFL